MKKLNKVFITALVAAGLVVFSAAFAIPTQMAQALIKTHQIENNAITSPKIKDGEVKTPDLATAAVTKEKLNPDAIKLLAVERTEGPTLAPAHGARGEVVGCIPGEVATGGGFLSDDGLDEIRNTPLSNNDGLPVGWAVNVVNPSDEDKPFTVFVVCSHLELGP